jgi:hypothetical protein
VLVKKKKNDARTGAMASATLMANSATRLPEATGVSRSEWWMRTCYTVFSFILWHQRNLYFSVEELEGLLQHDTSLEWL